LGFPLIGALPNGRTFSAEYDRDNIIAVLTQLQSEVIGKNSLLMLTMQRPTLLKNIELFAKKMNCGSLSIHHTYLISHHPTSFCSVMSRNVSKE
jgi:hypothetical protein